MTTRTAILIGNVDTSTNWSPVGVPTSTDDVICPLMMTIPAGVTFNPKTIAFTGLSDLSRAGLIISATGKFVHVDGSTFNEFNKMEVYGEWDLNGSNANYNISSGSDINNWIYGNGAKIWSSTGLGAIQKSDGAPIYGRLELSNSHLENLKFHYGAGYYGGAHVRVSWTSFYNMGHIQTSPWSYVGDDWYFEHCDFDGCVDPIGNECVLFDGASDFSGDSVTGDKRFEDNTFRYGNVTDPLMKISALEHVKPKRIYLDKVEVSYFNGDEDWSHIFSTANSFGSLNYKTMTEFAIIVNTDNPHTMPPPSQFLDQGFIEAIYPSDATDAGDHFIVGALGNEITNTVIIDGWGGVLINALGSDMSGDYKLNHCTVIVNCHDPNYGILARNEGGGKFTGTLELLNSIVRIRSNPSGASDIRVINIETAGSDQVTKMGHNCISGAGSTISTLFYQVTRTGKVYGDIDFGAGDLIGTNPNLVDETLGFVKWGVSLGLSTYQDTVDYLLNGINGYDQITKRQTGTITGKTVETLLTYYRSKAAPTNVILKDAGSDGVTIGALEYLTAGLRALVISGSNWAEITDSQLGTGLKPLILHNNKYSERSSTEGEALVIDVNEIRVISSGETLLI